MQISPTEAKKELAKRELARRKLSEFVRYNFPEYQFNWHHNLLIEKLEQVETGAVKRLIVMMPPRHGKSELCSIQFPAWLIGRNKDRHIIQASYSADLAVDFGRQTRNLIAATEYNNLFKTKLSEDSQAKGKWNTNGRGAYNAVGVGGATTGKGADFLIIDDPIKNRQDADSEVIRESQWSWYRSTARTRLSPNGAIVIVITRWHEDDLVGRILASENAHLWTILKLPAIAIEDEEQRKKGEPLWASKFSIKNLEETKVDLGSFEWSSLYQQEPVDEESREFKQAWFKYKKWEEVEKLKTRNFATIDTALSRNAKSDYTGVTRNYVDIENNWHLKSYRYRINSKDLIDLVFLLHEEGFEKIGIEEGAYLAAVEPFLKDEMKKRNSFPNVVTLKHGGTMKETRIRGLIPRYESGTIYHVDAPDLENELAKFPKGTYDDCADAAAYQLQIAQAPEALSPAVIRSRIMERERNIRLNSV